MGSNRGILMHISSLPSPYGIGNLGGEAFRFVDFLKEAGQNCWQILPQNPTGFGDSPYQSVSAFAGNPYFIDIDALIGEKLLKREEAENYFFGADPRRVDYGNLFFYRFPLLRRAFFRFEPCREYNEFVKDNAYWLEEYALFMALKEANHYNSWTSWEEPLKRRESKTLESFRESAKDTVNFYKFIQFKFFEQWYKLKEYANRQGIKIIGDMPIYVAMDSAEVWSERKLFMLDERDIPKAVAGCPPDEEFKSGQVWGNPLYDWEEMKKQGYAWWIRRVKQACDMYDMLRIDHFCGFFEYYSLPQNAADAKNGRMNKGPGKDLFDVLKEHCKIKIIAENVGNSSPNIKKAIKELGFVGINILEREIDYKNELCIKPENDAAYTSTHDNDTILGWYENLSQRKKRIVRKIFNIKRGDNPAEILIKEVLKSGAETTVIPIQDYLGYKSEGRMNTPSTVGGNWLFRVTKEELNHELAGYIKAMQE